MDQPTRLNTDSIVLTPHVIIAWAEGIQSCQKDSNGPATKCLPMLGITGIPLFVKMASILRASTLLSW